ncbi:reverse transcriptase, partial [Phytophthora megakarya]
THPNVRILSCPTRHHRFILDFAIYATTLYSLTARDFEERVSNPETRDLDKWPYAERAFDTLRSKIAVTPKLKYFDTDKQPVVIVYESDWAVSAVLTQDHDAVYLPVNFTSRALKPNELNNSIAEKKILALLRVLNECHNMLAGRTIRVLTRYTTLGWLFRSKGEEEIRGTLAASITPRAYVDAALEEIAPRKRTSRTAPIPVPKIGPTENLHVISFDGSAGVKREGGAFSVMMRGEMDCKSPGLKLLRQQAWNTLRGWLQHELLHVRRDWNASADMLAGQTLQRQQDKNAYNAGELEYLRTPNRLGEVVRPTTHDAECGEHDFKTEARDPDNCDDVDYNFERWRERQFQSEEKLAVVCSRKGP